MSESTQRSSLVKKLRPLDAQAIEVPSKSGVPDVNHTHGWIECKFRPKWPVRIKKDTIIKFPHDLQPAQKVWAKRRIAKGGAVVLNAKVDLDWFFWDMAWLDLNRFNNMTQSEMLQSCDLHYHRTIVAEELIDWLRSLQQ